MKCDNCGIDISPGLSSCPNCGKVFTYINQNNNYSIYNNVANNQNDNSKVKQKIIIGLLLVIILLLIFASILIISGSKTLDDGTRTVMIYMVGSNLESESKIATYDLDAIDPDDIDLEKVNVLLYTGGTEKWHNFVKNDENGLYILTSDGFEQLESYKKKNMGDPDTLRDLLEYGYNNYPAQYYDLILYNHGGALQGAIYDDFTKDNLSLKDFNEALSSSPFGSNNKLNTILFRTCLNGTIEVASVFAPYANYLIASEEITNGGESSVLNFLNEVEEDDDGVSYGKKFISAYEDQIDQLDPLGFGTMPMYSIIDLSKIDRINKLLDNFIEGIDLKEDYNKVVKVRSKLYQYGYTLFNIKDYDTVDLYSMVEELDEYSSESGKELLDAIDDAIIYNWSRQKNSHGLSIYFPYNASKENQSLFLDVYKGLDSKSSYYKFIGQFNSLSTSKGFSSFSSNNVMKNESKVSGQDFVLQLTDEQKRDYATSIYILFRKTDDGLYNPIYSSDNVELTDDGKLKTNISNNLIKVRDVSDDSEAYLMLVERSKAGEKVLSTTAMLSNNDWDNELKTAVATVYLKIENDVPKISSYVEVDSENGVSGAILNPDDYVLATFGTSHFDIYDKNGKYTENWDAHGMFYGFELYMKNMEFKKATLDENEDYYCVFKIRDIYGNEYYSQVLNVK